MQEDVLRPESLPKLIDFTDKGIMTLGKELSGALSYTPAVSVINF